MRICNVLLILTLSICNLYSLTKDELDFFEKKIRPVLTDNCYKCHSSKSEKVKGKLLLDDKAALLKGGDSGPSIVPGNPDKSLLLTSLRYANKDLQMPPSGKLSAAIISDFETWIKMGAPDPRLSTTNKPLEWNKTKEHWAYSPIIKPTIPVVKTKWASNPIDNFIFAKLREINIYPSISAERNVLLRRVYFDLIGLPPSDEESKLFLNDTSSDAYEKLVDKLLNSPRYGERWARHWLDTARYSDTTGSVNGNQEPRYTYSYTYRDYVIDAFNTDKPFNQFIIEQIAADRMGISDKKNLAALGFLTLGKSSGNNNDVIDDRIDVIFKGFMATTVVCARCHDHKFDPVSTKDYYAIHGILNSSFTPKDDEKPIIGEIKQTPEYADYLRKKASIERDVETFIDTRYAAAMHEFRTNSFKNIYGGYVLTSVAESNRVEYVRENGLNTRMIGRWTQMFNIKIAVSKKLNVKGGTKQKDDKINHPAFLPLAKMFKIPEQDFKVEFAKILSEHQEDINPFLLKYLKKSTIANMRDLANAYNHAIMGMDTVSDTIEGVVEFRESLYKKGGPLDIDRDSFQKYYSNNGKTMQYDNELRQQRGKLITHELTHVATPPRAMVLLDKGTPTDSQVLIKGDPGTRGPSVPHRFLEEFNYLNPNIFTNGSGRLELAKAIANPKNPLTARVIVNRVWQFHFGEGLVKSVDDFGINTEKPTEYELLNYLAARFMEDGWSIKKLHRLIMTSSTYKQVVTVDPSRAVVDSYNKYYWRMNIVRLDFETLRDTLLYVGGKLDFTTSGQSVNLATFNDGGYSTRRTIYGLIDRGRLPEVFTTFDFATPEMTTGQRFKTTVPKQALFLMNNPMIIEQVRNIINRPEFIGLTSEVQKMKALYHICFQREPTELELKVGSRYMSDAVKEDMSDAKPEYNWRYGYKIFDSNQAMSKLFNFSVYDKESYHMTNISFGNMSLNRNGGELMSNPLLYQIRQWTSPRDGSFKVECLIKIKPTKEPMSNVGLVLYKNGKPLKSLNITNYIDTTFQIELSTISVKDVIDFMLTNSSKSSREYTMSIKITEIRDENSLTPLIWNSQTDFRGPVKKLDRELDSWERYAHILILSNEMVFVN